MRNGDLPRQALDNRKEFSQNDGIFFTQVAGLLSQAEIDHLSAPPPPPPPPAPPHEWGAPPAKWNTLHIDGVRQVLARYPNGNPQDQTGICFSKPNHPGENCSGYLPARGQQGGSLPSGTAGATVAFGLKRGSSPTKGCKVRKTHLFCDLILC
jgi:hypothetical protein